MSTWDDEAWLKTAALEGATSTYNININIPSATAAPDPITVAPTPVAPAPAVVTPPVAAPALAPPVRAKNTHPSIPDDLLYEEEETPKGKKRKKSDDDPAYTLRRPTRKNLESVMGTSMNIKKLLLERAAENAFQGGDPRLANAFYNEIEKAVEKPILGGEGSIDEKLKSKHFTHPETGNKVVFKSLPTEMQDKIRAQMKAKAEKEAPAGKKVVKEQPAGKKVVKKEVKSLSSLSDDDFNSHVDQVQEKMQKDDPSVVNVDNILSEMKSRGHSQRDIEDFEDQAADLEDRLHSKGEHSSQPKKAPSKKAPSKEPTPEASAAQVKELNDLLDNGDSSAIQLGEKVLNTIKDEKVRDEIENRLGDLEDQLMEKGEHPSQPKKAPKPIEDQLGDSYLDHTGEALGDGEYGFSDPQDANNWSETLDKSQFDSNVEETPQGTIVKVTPKSEATPSKVDFGPMGHQDIAATHESFESVSSEDLDKIKQLDNENPADAMKHYLETSGQPVDVILEFARDVAGDSSSDDDGEMLEQFWIQHIRPELKNIKK